jgi:hypothetical protein
MSRYMTPPFGDFYGPGRGRGFGNSYALPMTPRGISRMQPIGYGMDRGPDMMVLDSMEDQGYGGYGIGRGGFDMSRIYEGLPAPGYIPGYGEVGGETDYGFYPQDTGGGGGGGEETEEQRRARQIRENEEEARRDYGGRGGDSSGRGLEVGSFGDWAGRMAEMARDAMQGAYQGDSSYGPGPGTGPSPDAKEGDPGGYSGGREGDMATGGRVRRFEAGGGADAGGAGDVRGQGGDQASYPDLMSMLNDPNFRGDWGKVLDMATVGPTRGFLEVSGIGRGGDYGTPSVEVDTSTGGMAERGASRDARGGAIHYASGGGGGGIGYAVGGPGDGRADKIPAMLSDGEHIIPADVVSGLGRGSSKAGHEKLNQMILKERAKYRKTLGKLPPPKD